MRRQRPNWRQTPTGGPPSAARRRRRPGARTGWRRTAPARCRRWRGSAGTRPTSRPPRPPRSSAPAGSATAASAPAATPSCTGATRRSAASSAGSSTSRSRSGRTSARSPRHRRRRRRPIWWCRCRLAARAPTNPARSPLPPEGRGIGPSEKSDDPASSGAPRTAHITTCNLACILRSIYASSASTVCNMLSSEHTVAAMLVHLRGCMHAMIQAF